MPTLIPTTDLGTGPRENPNSFEVIAAREVRLSRLLISYIAVGLFFMLLPGTFLGVWNLLAISSHRSIESVSAAWIQAHGHAQIFGWIGTFILGIGYYSIPKLRRMKPFGSATFLAFRTVAPVLPHGFDQRFLVLETWGFLVPFIWGFSAKWLPIFLGLRALRPRYLLWAVGLNSAGVIAALFGFNLLSSFLLLAAIGAAVYSLRLFEPSERPAKIKGVHRSFPIFIRLAYGWAIVSVGLAMWASFTAVSAGIWGASRHALTVGFIALMVFCVGQRVLPAFSGMRALFSTKLMFAALGLLFAGCFLRVGSEILAYQGFAGFAWSWLPVSAITELIAVTIFALNLAITFLSKRNRSELQYRNAA